MSLPAPQRQRTLARAVSLEGIGLHTGRAVRLTLRPAPPGSGVTFRRVDLPGAPEVPARVESVVDTRRATVLGRGEARVSTVEHLLSALHGLGVDNALVEVDAEEVPAADGSALPFCQLIAQAGLQEQEAVRPLQELTKPVWVAEGGALLSAVPAPAGVFTVRVIFTNDRRHPALTDQLWEGSIDPERYQQEIAPARTFGFLSELEALRQAGLGLGATPENAIAIGDEGVLTPLRFPDELVRHKVLDLVGDLSLVGPFSAHLVGIRTSHRLNHRLAQELARALQPVPVGASL